MFLFFIAVYLLIALPALMLIWAMLVVAKWGDEERGYDLPEDRISSFD